MKLLRKTIRSSTSKISASAPTKKSTINSSEYADDWYDDKNSVITGITKLFSCPNTIASIIYTWYKYEDVFEDFDNLEEFLDYISDDIYDMIDACDDEDLKQKVLDSIESSCNVQSSEESEDDLEQVNQEFTSKDTSINSSKLPAIYKLVNTCINCSEEGLHKLIADGGKLYGVPIQ